MNCPRCGTPTNPGVAFCPNCGLALNAPVQPVQQIPPAQYAPPMAAKKKSDKTLLIVAVIVIIVIVVIAAAAAAMGGSNTSTNNSNNNNNSNNSNTATNTQLTMTVSNIKGYHPQTQYVQADDGNILVMVYANLTNNGAMTMYVSPIYLDLTCSDGNKYSWSYKGDYSTSDYLAHGRTMALYCAFEIPEGVTPTVLKYDDSTDSIGVAISSSIVDLKIHQYATITSVSVSDASSGNIYITPDAGNKYVNVTLTLTNQMSSKLTLSPYYFTLETADGQTHDFTYDVNYVVPDGLQSGASSTIIVAFEISQSTTTTKLVYDDNINKLTVSLP